MAVENVDEDGFQGGIAHEDAKGVFTLVSGCAAADIEEVRGRAAGVLDDVHRGHGEASSVDHATDAAIELDVVEAVLRSFDFERIFFVEIAKAAKFLVTKEAVVVERHLGVKRDQLPIAGEDAGIDFEHGRIRIDEGAMQRLKKRRRVVGNVARKPEAERKFARLIRLQTDRRMNNFLDDGVRIFLRDFFDFHAARATRHKDDAADAAIDEKRKVKFALDVEAFFDEQPLDNPAAGTGLDRDEVHAEHAAGDFRGFNRRMDKFHAPGFSAATGVNLRLHYNNV